MMHYPQTVILPPKIYYYEPKIFGFKIAGKRGSHYYNPPTGNVKMIQDSMQSLEIEELSKNVENMHIGEKDDARKQEEAQQQPQQQGKKNKKKNKK